MPLVSHGQANKAKPQRSVAKPGVSWGPFCSVLAFVPCPFCGAHAWADMRHRDDGITLSLALSKKSQ